MNDYLIYTHGRMRRTLAVVVFFTQRLQLELSHIAQYHSLHQYHRIWCGCYCNMLILHLQPQLTKLGPDPIWMVLWYIHMHVRNWGRFYWHQQCHRRLRCMVSLPEFNDIGMGSNVNDLFYTCACIWRPFGMIPYLYTRNVNCTERNCSLFYHPSNTIVF